MKRVRITISPPDVYLPPIYRRLTIEAPSLANVQILNWNVAEPPVGFLLRVRGNYRGLDRVFEDAENVRDYGVFPNGEDDAYVFLAAETATPARTLFENFTRDDVLTVPPIDCHDDGSSTFTLVGTDAAVQAAVAEVPDAISTRVKAIGSDPIVSDDMQRALSPRQREAVQAALCVGYYAVPREATIEEVAAKMGCAKATAAEHLQKAEANVFEGMFEG